MSEELNVLAFLHERLENDQIPYMVTGSIAANYYTIPRMTRDIDIVVELKAPDVQKVLRSFEKDFYVDGDMVSDAIHQQGMFNIIHNQTLIKVDFIVRKNEVYRQEEFKRRRQIEIGNIKIWIVSLEDLILSKLFWAKDNFSERQLTDVKNLLNSSKTVDFNYLEKWLKEMELEEVYRRANT